MISTSAGSSSSSERGASRSVSTTSASASSCRPRTVISPGSPGPPPMIATPPRCPRPCRALSRPVGVVRDAPSHLGVVGPGADQPGADAVAVGVAALLPADPAGRGQVLQGHGDRGRDQDDVGARVEQCGDPAGGDGSPADDHHPAAAQPQPEQVRVHGSLSSWANDVVITTTRPTGAGRGDVIPVRTDTVPQSTRCSWKHQHYPYH